MFRVIEMHKPTVMLDEGDGFLEDKGDVLSLLKDGHRKGGQAIRLVGDNHEPRCFSVWAPVAIAMIGKSLPDGPLHDRAVVIRLRRRKSTERVQSFRSDRTKDLTILARKMARWTGDNAEILKQADPDVGGMQNRVADNWRPLFAIADAAGGEWPKRTRDIARLANKEAADQSVRAVLLADIKAFFDAKAVDRIASEDLAKHLGDMEERPWAEWGKSGRPITQAAIARLLASFQISPKQLRLPPDDRNRRGYELSQFTETFEVYLSPEGGSQSATPLQSNSDVHCSTLEGATPSEAVAGAEVLQSLQHKHCSGVALQKPPPAKNNKSNGASHVSRSLPDPATMELSEVDAALKSGRGGGDKEYRAALWKRLDVLRRSSSAGGVQ